MSYTNSDIAAFRRTVWNYWKKNGRHELPWRKTTDPYRILVSEVMLQQTQVSRVIEKYKEFLKAFPTVKDLARPNLTTVLRVWSGMGYNRRAKYLHDAAKQLMLRVSYSIPVAYGDLRKLSGVGPYTASAVRVFAFNESDVLIETNIRTAYIHHFFNVRPTRSNISDKKIRTVAISVAEGEDPREWHWALMDYGAHIKKLHKNPARRSAHYTRQSKFEGSLRQVRGEILRQLMKGRKGVEWEEGGKMQKALEGLARDGLIENKKGKWRIA